MKLGILGTGAIVKEFLPWLAQSPAVELAALCSTPRSAQLATQLCIDYHIPRQFTDYAAMLEAVDTVYIALPNHLHAPYAKKALEAGRNVIVEKPMAATDAEAEQLAALARKIGRAHV